MHQALSGFVPKRFWGPPDQQKTLRNSVLEAELTNRQHDSNNFAENIFFLNFVHISLSGISLL
jgi:hypothetical protein